MQHTTTNKRVPHTHTHTYNKDSFGQVDIPIVTKLYEFYKLLYTYLRLFPKKDRYSLGQKIDTLTLDLIQLVIVASTNPREKKLPYLEKAVACLDLLKLLLRLAKDIEALENKKYIVLQEEIQEIGRMLGGWKKSILPLL